MMISPEGYISMHENDSFEELISERKKLIKDLDRLEAVAYEKEHSGEAWRILPGPDVQYQMTLEYLAQLCNFLKEKYNREIACEEEEE